MNNNTTKYFAPIIIAFTLILSACNEGGSGLTGVKNPSEIEGKWLMTQRKSQGTLTFPNLENDGELKTQKVDEAENFTAEDNYYVHFKPKNVYESRSPEESELPGTESEAEVSSGTWKFENGKLVIQENGDPDSVNMKLDPYLRGNELIMKTHVQSDFGTLGNIDMNITITARRAN